MAAVFHSTFLYLCELHASECTCARDKCQPQTAQAALLPFESIECSALKVKSDQQNDIVTELRAPFTRSP